MLIQRYRKTVRNLCVDAIFPQFEIKIMLIFS
jgi:hypothetical protein